MSEIFCLLNEYNFGFVDLCIAGNDTKRMRIETLLSSNTAEAFVEKTERRFKDGDFLFRENELSNSVYFLVQGNVELSKTGQHGPVMLAMLEPNEMFDEFGIVDGGLRSTNAVAVGDIVVEETTRDLFLDALSNEAGIAVDVMGKLANRIYQANERLSHPKTAVAKIHKNSGFFSVMGFFRKLAIRGGNVSGSIEIRVLPLLSEDPDAADVQKRHIVKSLGKRSGIKVRAFNENLDIDTDLHPDDRFMKLRDHAEQILYNSNGDLIIYGEIRSPGTTLTLYFLSANTDSDDRPGFTLPSTMLTLPVDFEYELAELLLAVALSVTSFKDEGKRMRLGQALSETLYAAMPAVQSLPQDLSSRERASIQMCYGNAVATLAFQRGTTDLYHVAAQTYRAALEQLSRGDSPIDWALTQKHLGASLQAIVENTSDEDTLRQAADAFEACLEIFRRENYPMQWASAQNRLGQVLYKLDLKTGEQETLKKSLAAFQAALQVFNRNEFPLRWADVMNNFAQAAQVLGEQLHNAEVLEKAVNACLGVLEIRRKEKGPLQWAATQNNLGSAMFLLGKLTGDKARLEGAEDAFDQALGVYMVFKAEHLAAVARKNLSRVRFLLGETPK
jgi:CRP-like cAMP-binding protein/tetratricopeptide (TPR) repeat protein